jgi:hypothetical protein
MTVYNPTGASGKGDKVKLAGGTPFTKEYVLDRVIRPLFVFENITSTHTLCGLIPGTGHPVMTQCNSSGLMAALLNADNEGYSWLWLLPQEIDLGQTIKFRVSFSNSEAVNTALTAAWTFSYTPMIMGTTALAATVTSLTATSTTAALGANVYQNSNWATMTASTLTTVTPGEDGLSMKVIVDVTTMADASLYKGEVEFARKWIG